MRLILRAERRILADLILRSERIHCGYAKKNGHDPSNGSESDAARNGAPKPRIIWMDPRAPPEPRIDRRSREEEPWWNKPAPLPLPRSEPQKEPAVAPALLMAPLAPLVEPKQVATLNTSPLTYDPMNPPPLEKCFRRRKILSSGKTGFIIGYDLRDQAAPKVEVQWAGEFREEGQPPFKLAVSR
jgi:hypothetical protein